MSDHHALNKLLANVAGAVVWEEKGYWWYSHKGHPSRWTPFQDANQMELVKDGLRRDGYEYGSGWNISEQEFCGHIYKNRGKGFDPPVMFKTGLSSESEAMALALAIKAMKGEG